MSYRSHFIESSLHFKPCFTEDERDEETIISVYKKDTEDTVIDVTKKHDTTIPHAVNLGLSVLWADCNVGESLNTPTGILFGWGDATPDFGGFNISDTPASLKRR